MVHRTGEQLQTLSDTSCSGGCVGTLDGDRGPAPDPRSWPIACVPALCTEAAAPTEPGPGARGGGVCSRD